MGLPGVHGAEVRHGDEKRLGSLNASALRRRELKQKVDDTMDNQQTDTSPSVDADCSASFAVRDLVIVTVDGDGATGKQGIVTAVWPSGRCTVTFEDGSFRSLPSDALRAA